MTVFLGDLHLGRAPAEQSRAAEADAVALLASYRDRLVREGGRVLLVGDVFDAYIEYQGMVPAGFVRFQGMLANLVDAGVQVDYVVGNRDHWHIAHFERELDIHPAEQVSFDAFGRRVHVEHGDRHAPGHHPSKALRPLLRSRAAYWLYRNVPPGDSGFRVARWLAGMGEGSPRDETVEALRRAAQHLIREEIDVVVMGHCHQEELTPLDGGYYLNTGYWYGRRTYGLLTEEGPSLKHWNG